MSTRTSPALIRAVLMDAERTTPHAAAKRARVGSSSVYSWQRRAAAQPGWPNDDDIASWHRANAERAEHRARDADWRKRVAITKRPQTVPALGTQRRLHALMALGWTKEAIGAEMGVTKHRIWQLATGQHCSVLGVTLATAEKVATTYERLSMVVPVGWVADRQRRAAKRLGYAPPLAWDDIDNDDAPVSLRYLPADRAVVIRDMADLGVGITEACRRLHLSRSAVERYCQRNGLRAEYERLAKVERVGDNQYVREAS